MVGQVSFVDVSILDWTLGRHNTIPPVIDDLAIASPLHPIIEHVSPYHNV